MKHFIRNPAVAEQADRTALSQTAVLHADDGYCRRGNFGSSLVYSNVITRWHQRLWFKTQQVGSLREGDVGDDSRKILLLGCTSY